MTTIKVIGMDQEERIFPVETSWTVLRIKETLAREWAFKPPVDEQRLIYAGKLLTNESKLQDVLLAIDPPHIFHVVCKNYPAKPEVKADDPVPGPSKEPAETVEPSPVSHDEYQAHVMRHMYTQYINSYMHYMNQYQHYGVRTDMPPMDNGGAVPPNVHPPPPAPAPARAPAEEDEFVGRDVLDWFYVMLQVMIFFYIVYSYSSFQRFALVSTLAFILYLYQAGLIGQQLFPQVPPPQGDEAANEAANETVELESTDEGESEEEEEEREEEVVQEQESPLRVVVLNIGSFFTSLLPDYNPVPA